MCQVVAQQLMNDTTRHERANTKGPNATDKRKTHTHTHINAHKQKGKKEYRDSFLLFCCCLDVTVFSPFFVCCCKDWNYMAQHRQNSLSIECCFQSSLFLLSPPPPLSTLSFVSGAQQQHLRIEECSSVDGSSNGNVVHCVVIVRVRGGQQKKTMHTSTHVYIPRQNIEKWTN